MSTPLYNQEDVLGVECRHAVYCKPPDGFTDDFHVVKEVVHFKDGTKKSFLRGIRNFQRPFWVTRKAHRTHKQKREWEKLDKVQEFKSTQSQLVRNISRALEEGWFQGNLRRLCRNPYVYGADILSTAIIKRHYQTKYPDFNTPYSVATYDTETDVVRGTKQITMATITMKGKDPNTLMAYTAIQKDFLKGFSNTEERLKQLHVKYILPLIGDRKIEWVVDIVDNEIEVVKKSIGKAHEWAPDFLAIWNIDFDITRIMEACDRAGVNPKDIFSDPSVPDQFKHFEFVRGPSQKVTASGKVTPIKPAARWHTVYCPASFYLIDAMCAYRHIRTGVKELPSYSLDSILNLVLGIRKLTFKEADHVPGGLPWHEFMQSRHQLEYVIYHEFDTISMEMLDEKTRDLDVSLPMMSGCSDFANFKSQPRRLVDELHFFVQTKGYVMGTTSDQMTTELDELCVSAEEWIVMLDAHLVDDNGLQVIEEMPTLRTNIRRDVGDLLRHTSAYAGSFK